MLEIKYTTTTLLNWRLTSGMIAKRKKLVSMTEVATIRPRRGPPVMINTTKTVAAEALPRIIAVS